MTSGAPLTNTSMVGFANRLTMTLILRSDDTNSKVWIMPNSIGGACSVVVVSYQMKEWIG